MVHLSLSLFFCYILHWIISFLLRFSFLLWCSELQLDNRVRPEKEWFPRRTRDTEESAVPCNTSCHGSYLQKAGMKDVLLVSGRRPTIKEYAVPGSPLRRSDALSSWLIMRNSSSWRLARISSCFNYDKRSGEFEDENRLRNWTTLKVEALSCPETLWLPVDTFSYFRRHDFSLAPLREHQILSW
jgi:hypothetical protein